MTEFVVFLATLLLVAGVIGSFLPMVPSGLLSLAGVFVYARYGPGDLGLLLLASMTVAGVLAALLEHFAGALTARAAGASRGAVLFGLGIGVLLFFVAGPVGLIVGLLGGIFYLEIRAGVGVDEATRRTCYGAAGVLGSSLAQAALTLSILVAFLLFVRVL
ncbi:DUF456 domain-containing protein [Halorubrum gandharaense]